MKDGEESNKPAAPDAGIAPQLTIEHNWPGAGEAGRQALSILWLFHHSRLVIEYGLFAFRRLLRRRCLQRWSSFSGDASALQSPPIEDHAISPGRLSSER